MFATEINIPVGGTNHMLQRVNQDGYSSEYRFHSDNLSIKCFIRNSSSLPKGATVNRERHNVEVTLTRKRIDGTLSSMKVYTVVDHEPMGSVDDAVDLLARLGWFTLTRANVEKLMNFES